MLMDPNVIRAKVIAQLDLAHAYLGCRLLHMVHVTFQSQIKARSEDGFEQVVAVCRIYPARTCSLFSRTT